MRSRPAENHHISKEVKNKIFEFKAKELDILPGEVRQM
jgi:hypothetical protein